MKEPTNGTRNGATPEEPAVHHSFKLKAVASLPKTYWCFLAIMGLFMLSRTPESYMLLSLKTTGLPLWFCSGTIGFFNVVSVFVSYPAGRFSDKIGRARVLFFSFVTLSFSLLCFSLNSCFFGVLGVILWGIQRSTSQILSVACISDIVQKKILGTAIGLLNLLMCFTSIVSGYICGKVATHFDFYMSYKMSTAISIVAMVTILFYEKYYTKRRVALA
jgi:MFS family permease